MIRGAAAAFVAVLVAMTAAACQPPEPARPYVGPAGAPRVAVVGDSITNYSSTQVQSAMSGYRVSINSVPGIDLADGRAQLVKPVMATKPDVLVIELGINSAREVWDSADLVHLEGIMADAASVPCVIWVTPTALAPSYYDHLGKGYLRDRIAAMKASVAKRVAKRPNFHLADWGEIEGQHPEWFDADHLHPTTAGKVAYAQYLNEQVGALCQ